ncbi:MAG TPA: ferritin-like domain-containing protein [Kofleriaceae bacterium]|nr:ferritin-like domain-containing protein [Kofleriaceae bacterium]
MTERSGFQLDLGGSVWNLPEAATIFSWDYADGRDQLLSLYEKGKKKQWNSANRIDWSHEIDLDNPMAVPDFSDSMLGPEGWARLSDKEKGQIRLHSMSWQFSQFLHGEQGALLCAAKLVHAVPQMDAKMYTATQVIDEARHVEVYTKYLDDKLGLTYPCNRHLKTLLGQVITDSRWDITSLGMQIIIEGLALASLNFVRDFAREPLVRSIVTYVMQDEARHVAFGRLALRDLYPQLTEAERKEREEFVVEACYLMRDRFIATDVWENLGFDVEACTQRVTRAPETAHYRALLFTRLAPIIKDVGLLGPTVQKAFEAMGVMQFTKLDIDSQSRRDEEAGDALDLAKAAANTKAVIAAGQAAE